MPFGALPFSAVERPTYVSILAVSQSGLRRAVIVKDDIALPEHRPCTGDWVARFVAAFLVDCIVFLVALALNEVEV